jgi:hypothetical protein
MMATFDVWIMRFEPGDTPPAERLQSTFGLDAASAESLERGLPKIVKHAVPAKAAGEMRQALEAIGAVVECRPARSTKPVRNGGGEKGAAIFHPPGADLLVAGRVSAIDVFAPTTAAHVPRISVDEAVAASSAPRMQPASESAQPRRISASLMATSIQQQRRKFIVQAIGTIVAGVAVLAIDWFLGNSVFRGEADWIGIGFDGFGIYLVGVGAYDLVTTLRS